MDASVVFCVVCQTYTYYTTEAFLWDFVHRHLRTRFSPALLGVWDCFNHPGYGWCFHFFGCPTTYFAACIVSGRTSAVKYFSPSRKSLTAAALPNERVDKAKYTGVSAVPHFPTHQLSFSCRVIGSPFCHCHLLLCPCLIDMAELLFFYIGKERRQLCFFMEKNTVIP